MIILIAIFIIFLFFRLANLNIIPVFADEAIYIHWAQQAWHNPTLRFISLTDGKPPLHSWLMIPFLKIIQDPLIAGRFLSVLSGLMTLFGTILIAKRLFNKQFAITAGLLVAICPFLVFYDRLAVADSLLTAFGVWSFYLTLLLFGNPDLGKSFLLGFCWGGALLTKQPALYFIFLSPVILVLRQKSNKIKLINKYLNYWLLSLGISILFYNLIKLSPYSHLINIRSYDYILSKREFLQHPLKLFWGNLKAIIPWIYSYQTVIPTIFFIIGLIFMFKNHWEKAIVVFFWLFFPILGSAAIGKIIFPRYFVFIEPWIIIFIIYGIYCLIKKVKFYKNKNLLILTIYLSIFLPWCYYSIFLIFRPEKAPLIEREQNQYLTTWASGYGIKEIATYLKTNYSKEKVYVATEGYFGTLPDGLQIYLDGFDNILVYGIGQPISKIPESTWDNAKKYPTFLVVNDSRFNTYWDNLILIAKYQKPKFSFLNESLLFIKLD